MEKLCTLCKNHLKPFANFRDKDYFYCDFCKSIQLDNKYFLSKENEFNRYNLHNNDVLDINYQKFVMPIVNYVLKHYTHEDIGLDYGCGPGPVVKKLLEEKAYQVKLYDPYFYNDSEALNVQYDFIILSEVAEHFYYPNFEFSKLKSMLKPNGALIIMTLLYNPEIDFLKWHYKNDETHVFFYSESTFKYIQKTFGFNQLFFDNRLIILKD
ncbi:MAG: class I SAM-dependent methyltransferase [Candidatus Izemoplasmatales bacterium]|jgi:2-polyprenyl-3-methyl-5-hydroxy-6-metoxy-1,4-benzoquinol methylase